MVRKTAKSLMVERTWNKRLISGHGSGVDPGPNKCPAHHLCWEISTGLELFEEGGHEEGGEEEDGGPEENVWSVRTVVTT